MEPQTKDFHHIIRRCQTLNAMNKRLAKLTDNMATLSPDIRRRRYISIQVAQEKLALQEHELHCEMVALGIADANEDRYGNVTLTFQFGPTVLYFHRPGEAPTVQDGDQGELSPLEMAIEETKRSEPRLSMYDATTEQKIDPVEALKTFPKVEGKQFFEDSPVLAKIQDNEEGNQKFLQELADLDERIEELEDELAVQMARQDKGKKNTVDAARQALETALKYRESLHPKPGEEVVQVRKSTTPPAEEGPSMDSWAKKMEAEEPPVPTKPQQLKAAQKHYDATGEVQEGFTLISGKIYRKVQSDDPDRHLKAAEDQAEETPPAEKPAKTKKEPAPKKEPPVKKEPEALVKDDGGGPWSGTRKVSDELTWD